jgi:hypothetical protein
MTSSEFSDGLVIDTFGVTVRLYKSTKKDSNDEFDSGLNHAHAIKTACIKVGKVISGNNIKKVICESITPEFAESNDNLTIYTLRFKATALFKAT